MTVRVERDAEVVVVVIDRPAVRNAVDGPTAQALAAAFRDFDADDSLRVAVLTGEGGTFCAGADLHAIAEGAERANRVAEDGDAPMGVSRLLLGKPVIAAVEGHAVAGGLELALWCDLRVASDTAVFGVFCRRFGVPLIDGGTIRLARVIGQGRALDMVLTGRAVGADEARAIGLADRLVPAGTARTHAVSLAHEIAAHPQTCLRADRRSLLTQWGLDLPDALLAETRGGMRVLASGETQQGARRFASGAGRHGASTTDAG